MLLWNCTRTPKNTFLSPYLSLSLYLFTHTSRNFHKLVKILRKNIKMIPCQTNNSSHTMLVDSTNAQFFPTFVFLPRKKLNDFDNQLEGHAVAVFPFFPPKRHFPLERTLLSRHQCFYLETATKAAAETTHSKEMCCQFSAHPSSLCPPSPTM